MPRKLFIKFLVTYASGVVALAAALIGPIEVAHSVGTLDESLMLVLILGFVVLAHAPLCVLVALRFKDAGRKPAWALLCLTGWLLPVVIIWALLLPSRAANPTHRAA